MGKPYPELEAAPILVGDIGGTNSRLAIAYPDQDGLRVEGFKKFRGDNYNSLDAIIAEYLSEIDIEIKYSSLAVAGPVKFGATKLTNRSWNISEREMCDKFAFEQTLLSNDFQAMSRSIPHVEGLQTVYEPPTKPDKTAPILVAGPGTGFGMGILVPVGDGYHVITGEGGHQAYSPQSKIETEILHLLQEEIGYVSVERVTSGSGMDDVHRAVCKRHGTEWQQIEPALVRELALAGDKVCHEVGMLRATAVMGTVGDMALAAGCRGGVVLAGGVSERLIDYIGSDEALQRFFERGPMSEYMKYIQIKLLTDPHAPLLGAAALFLDHSRKNNA